MYRKSDYITLAAVSRLNKMQNSVLWQNFLHLITSIVILVVLLAQIFIYSSISCEQ